MLPRRRFHNCLRQHSHFRCPRQHRLRFHKHRLPATLLDDELGRSEREAACRTRASTGPLHPPPLVARSRRPPSHHPKAIMVALSRRTTCSQAHVRQTLKRSHFARRSRNARDKLACSQALLTTLHIQAHVGFLRHPLRMQRWLPERWPPQRLRDHQSSRTYARQRKWIGHTKMQGVGHIIIRSMCEHQHLAEQLRTAMASQDMLGFQEEPT